MGFVQELPFLIGSCSERRKELRYNNTYLRKLGQRMETATLRAKYDKIKAEATALAGDPLDIPRRVVILSNLFLDSGRNHTFSQLAAHGALWAFRYFEIGGRLGHLIARRYFYNPTERAFRLRTRAVS